MSKIVIDPVTRIEGHLRMETTVDSGAVSGAWSTGTLFRGLETILKNRDPRDAWMMTQRICGVCTYVHGLASVRSIENSVGLTVPDNARLVRNILMGAQYIQDHIVHFYHLNALDWIDVGSALTADPTLAKAADDEICSTRNRSVQYFTDLKTKLSTFSGMSQLGPFSNGYWGHPGYKLTPAQNLVLVANYLEALSVQREIANIHAYLGGKNPHPQSLLIGGIAQTDMTRLQQQVNSYIPPICTMAKEFIDKYYLPDVAFVAKTYKPDYANTGGFDNLLCVGEFPQDSSTNFFPSGVIMGRDHTSIGTINVASITEDVTRSWYTGNSVLHPSIGITTPEYTGVNTADKYSWLKAPRYNGSPMEVGPLARVMVAYGKNASGVRALVDSVLSQVGFTISQMYSTLGRVAARAIETKLIADAMIEWNNQLLTNISLGNTATRLAFVLPTTTCEGFSLSEAPRGALGHWVKYSNSLTDNYQMVVPSTWNFSPRDHDGVPGPVENALIGTQVYDESKPLEVLRVVHSFDPCIACAVH